MRNAPALPTMNTTRTPAALRTTGAECAEFVTEIDGRLRGSRTIAVPAGLTHAEAVAWCEQYRGTYERLAQFVTFT